LITVVAAAAGFGMAIGGWTVLLAVVAVLQAGTTLQARTVAVPVACIAGVVAGHVVGAAAADLAGGGYGLAGMRERLRLVGGSLTAGPLAGGWTVRAEVPG
jgi:hypothetical protein